MFGDNVLGYYTWEGILFISTEVASDEHRLAEVINHEGTHHILTATTPYGLVQAAVQSAKPPPWAPDNPIRQKIAQLLADSGRWTHEAAATFSAIALLPETSAQETVANLPPFYQDGYAAFERFFANRSYDPITTARLSRSIAARALQTPILNVWGRDNLASPPNLAEHLKRPEFSPNARLEAILAALAQFDDSEVRKWAGKHHFAGNTVVLQPRTSPPLAGINFTGSPPGDVISKLKELVATIGPEHSEEADETLDVKLSAAIGPSNIVLEPVSGTFVGDSGTIDEDWCQEVDVIRVNANVFDTPIFYPDATGGLTIPSKQALLLFYRPDYRYASGTLVPIDLVDNVLYSLFERQVTVCLDGFSLLPTRRAENEEEENRPIIADGSVKWLPNRRIMVHAHGGPAALFPVQGILSWPITRQTAWSYHAMLSPLATTWGTIVFKRTDTPAPAIVFPTLRTEWDRLRPAVVGNAPPTTSEDPDGRTFFSDSELLVDVLRFQRVFSGLVMSPGEWRRAADNSVALMMRGAIYKDSDVQFRSDE